MNFAITGAFEFLKNHFVHSAAGINQRGSNNGQATAFFNFPGCTEKTFWALQCIGINTTRQHFSR